MKKFVIIYYLPAGALEKMQTSPPEVMQAEMKAWMDWFAQAGDAVVDQGEFFANRAKVNGENVSEASHDVSGYSIIQAENFEAAKDMVKSHPHVGFFEGCDLEIFEPMEMHQG